MAKATNIKKPNETQIALYFKIHYTQTKTSFTGSKSLSLHHHDTNDQPSHILYLQQKEALWKQVSIDQPIELQEKKSQYLVSERET